MKVAWQVLIFISLHDMNNPSEVLASTLPLLSPGDHHHNYHHQILLSAQCREKKVEGSIMNNPTLH